MSVDDVDLAKTDPCPECGTSVRRFASTPIRGNSVDPEPSGPWHCAECLKYRCIRAAAGITAPLPDLDRFDNEAPSQLSQESLA